MLCSRTNAASLIAAVSCDMFRKLLIALRYRGFLYSKYLEKSSNCYYFSRSVLLVNRKTCYYCCFFFFFGHIPPTPCHSFFRNIRSFFPFVLQELDADTDSNGNIQTEPHIMIVVPHIQTNIVIPALYSAITLQNKVLFISQIPELRIRWEISILCSTKATTPQLLVNIINFLST